MSEAWGSGTEEVAETSRFEGELSVNNVTDSGDKGDSNQIFNVKGGSSGHAGALALHIETVNELSNVGKIYHSMQLPDVKTECCKQGAQSSGALAFQMEVQGGDQVHCIAPNEKRDEPWLCAICRDRIKVEETAQIKGCEHSYCVTCILRWASYKTEPWCPQCRLPFSFLYVYRALDGSLSEYLFEESVCLLLRAFWFKPLQIQEVEEQDDLQDDYDVYEEYYYTSNVRLGNRRWGDSGYVRGGRREARPVGVRQVAAVASECSSAGSSSRQAKGKEPAKEATGRRARRAQKRELFDKMVGKQQHSEGKSVSSHTDINKVN